MCLLNHNVMQKNSTQSWENVFTDERMDGWMVRVDFVGPFNRTGVPETQTNIAHLYWIFMRIVFF